MAIKSINVLNVLVFQRGWRNVQDTENDTLRQDGFALKFCDGINVLLGQNGTGKTTLLKMIYAATQ